MALLKLRDDTELYYKDWGSGKPVLFSHGWPLSADMWDAQMLFFASHGYRAVAFDRRGFGRSSQPWSGYDYDTFADDIAELIDHLDLKEIALVGFSMGGGDIARYVARHGSTRVSRLALISAVTPLFVKTSDHDGVDKTVFDGIKTGLIKDRPQFLDDFSALFYGTNHGVKVSQACSSKHSRSACKRRSRRRSIVSRRSLKPTSARTWQRSTSRRSWFTATTTRSCHFHSPENLQPR